KSEAVRIRLRHLLQRLIAFANYELTDCEHLERKISVRWIDVETASPKLIVKTEIRFLAALVSPTVTAKTKAHLKQDLRSLKDFLGRLEDNRDRTQGTGLWHFTLKLWHRSAEKNLIAFDELWQQRKAATKATPTPPASIAPSTASSIAPSTASLAKAESIVALPLPQASPTEAPPIYHNLPARDYGTFIGRSHLLTQLLSFLRIDHPVSRISLIGIGGIGKTALALEVAHRCLRQSQNADDQASRFSALIFVSAKIQRLTPQGILPSYRYSRTLQDIFRAIAHTLKHPERLAGDFNRQLENTYALLSAQRTLLIIDNLETLQSEDQQAVLSFLYDLPTTVKALVTSRRQLTMDAVIPLPVLSADETQAFIQAQSELKAIALTEPAAQNLYRQTGGTPAAIVYALGQVAAGYRIPDVLPRLATQSSDYCSYYLEATVNALQGHATYSLLTALAFFPKDASRQALIEISQLTDDDAVETLAKLQQLGLVYIRAAGDESRFFMLPLTREYLLNQPSEQLTLAVRERWLVWHIDFLAPYRALSWRVWHDYGAIDAEWENLQAAVEWCIAANRPEDFEQLWAGLRGYTHLRGYWNERLGWLEWWCAVSRQKEDALTTMKALRDLGWSLTLIGEPQQLEQANDYFEQAWRYRQEATPAFQVDLAIESAILALFQGRLPEVQPWLTTAKALLLEASLSAEEMVAEQIRLDYYTAQLFYRQKNYAEAKSFYSALLVQVQAVEKPTPQQQQVEVYSLNWLVDIALQQSDLSTAEVLLAESWPMIEHRQDVRSQAFHQRSKAQLEKYRGNLLDFRRWSQQAKNSFERLGMQTQALEMQAWLNDASSAGIS
ncbi:MAG: AAA family ATPase, partial [Cyanobacteria bacterium J06560_2]